MPPAISTTRSSSPDIQVVERPLPAFKRRRPHPPPEPQPQSSSAITTSSSSAPNVVGPATAASCSSSAISRLPVSVLDPAGLTPAAATAIVRRPSVRRPPPARSTPTSTAALARPKPPDRPLEPHAVVVPQTDAGFLEALRNPCHAVHKSSTAVPLPAFVPYQPPPLVSRPQSLLQPQQQQQQQQQLSSSSLQDKAQPVNVIRRSTARAPQHHPPAQSTSTAARPDLSLLGSSSTSRHGPPTSTSSTSTGSVSPQTPKDIATPRPPLQQQQRPPPRPRALSSARSDRSPVGPPRPAALDPVGSAPVVGPSDQYDDDEEPAILGRQGSPAPSFSSDLTELSSSEAPSSPASSSEGENDPLDDDSRRRRSTARVPSTWRPKYDRSHLPDVVGSDDEIVIVERPLPAFKRRPRAERLEVPEEPMEGGAEGGGLEGWEGEQAGRKSPGGDWGGRVGTQGMGTDAVGVMGVREASAPLDNLADADDDNDDGGGPSDPPVFTRRHNASRRRRSTSPPPRPSAPKDDAHDLSPILADANRPRRRTAHYTSANAALSTLSLERKRKAAKASLDESLAVYASIPLERPTQVDPTAGLLPSEVLNLLVSGPLEGPWEPSNVESLMVPCFRALERWARPAVERLRKWDTGWERMAVQQRVDGLRLRVRSGPLGCEQGGAVGWTGLKLYGSEWTWDEVLCLWHIHTQILTCYPSPSPTWDLIHQYAPLSPPDPTASASAATADEQMSVERERRLKRKERLREVAMGWLAEGESARREYDCRHGELVKWLRNGGLTLIPRSPATGHPPPSGPPPTVGATHLTTAPISSSTPTAALSSLIVVGPPPTWDELRQSLRAWGEEVVLVCEGLKQVDRERELIGRV